MRQNASELKAEIDKLRSDLWFSRMALVGIASPEFRDLFAGIHGCKSRKEAWDWLRSTTERAVDRAKPNPPEEMGDLRDSTPRSYCPMCWGSSHNIHRISGFAYPEGLRRHLEGEHNARQCEVMKAAFALACDAAEQNTMKSKRQAV